MKRIGLMGCGVVAMEAHLPVLAQIPDLKVVAVYDPNEAAARKAAQLFGVPRHTTSQETFFKTPMDGVSICSSAPAHYRNVLGAAAKGLPVLCEKPIAMDDHEAIAMIRAMDEAGLGFFIGFCYRFSENAQRIRQIVQTGGIGTARLLRLQYVWNLHGRMIPGKTRNSLVFNQRREDRMLEGGPMVDCGVHQIDLARWWLGSEVVRFEGIGQWIENYTAPDHMYLHMDHANGAHTTIEISFSYGHTAKEPVDHFAYELVGTDGVIRYNREQQIFEARNSQHTARYNWHGEKNFLGLYQAFSRFLHTGEAEELPTADDGLMATRIAREATQQAIENRFLPQIEDTPMERLNPAPDATATPSSAVPQFSDEPTPCAPTPNVLSPWPMDRTAKDEPLPDGL
jgi:predicted dehydrogenase